MRLQHLQGKRRRHRGIESVAAFLQCRHADSGRDPMGGGNDPECSLNLGTRCERVRIDLGDIGFHAPAM